MTCAETKMLRIRPKLLLVDEVAERLAVRRAWVYEHAAEMGAVKLAGLLRFPEDKLDDWINGQSLGGNP